jgi:cytochrome bd ubiquinol oxidase subunit II
MYVHARTCAIALVVLVVITWAWAKGDTLAPAEVAFTIENSKAHPATLAALLFACGAGALVLFPSLILLFRVFGRRDTETQAGRH